MVFLAAYTLASGTLETMPMLPTGLRRHPDFGTYYLHRRIPTDLLSCYPGKEMVSFSLRTKDYHVAVERHRLEEAKLTSNWGKQRQRLADQAARQHVVAIVRIDAMTSETIDAICKHVEAVSLAGDEARVLDENYTIEEIEDYQAGYAEANRLLKAALVLGKQDVLRPPLEEFLRLYRYELNVPEGDMRRLALAYGRTVLRTNEKLLSRYAGNDEPTPVVARSLATPQLSEVTTAYLTHYAKLDQPAMLKKIRTAMPLLLDIVGDKPIGALRQDDLETFFDSIQNLPPHWSAICRRQKLTPRKLVEMGVGEMAKATFTGTYLAVMVPFIKYCRRKWQDRGWPMGLTAEGVQYTGNRKDPENGQRAFKLHELQRLFQGPEMAGFARTPEQAHMFWLPHVGLFTGARVNELCQLNPQADILQSADGIWYFNITDRSESHEKVDKSVKNKSSKRAVPIHPQLIEIGFLDYVERIKQQGHTLLFPGFPPSAGKASPKALEWFGEFLRDIGLRDETPNARIVGMHAFRFTLLNRAMALRIAGAEAITGHTSNVTQIQTVTDGQVEQKRSDVVVKYQGQLPVDQKMAILQRITYEGLKFHVPVTPSRSQP
ncbi:hypothetical protein OSTOST_08703 [Ostertagia ostertagi]